MPKPPPRTTYAPCENCRFYITEADSYCPNCGIVFRATARMRAVSFWLIFAGVPLLFCSLLLMAPSSGEGLSAAMQLPAGVAQTGVVASFFMLVLGAGSLSRTKTRSVNLQKSESLLTSRLESLAKKQIELIATRKRLFASLNANAEENKAADALDNASAALEKQSARSRNQLREIQFTRWINRLEPLAADWGALTEATCDQRIKRIADAIETGGKMLEEWERDIILSGEAGKSKERLQNALETCSHLQGELVAKKASFVIEGVSPLLDSPIAPLSVPASDYKTDLFTARVEAIQEIWSSYETLEETLQTLQSR